MSRVEKIGKLRALVEKYADAYIAYHEGHGEAAKKGERDMPRIMKRIEVLFLGDEHKEPRIERGKPFKLCGCGKSYTVREWDELPLLGVVAHDVEENGPPARLEYKTCSCGSTITVHLTPLPSSAGVETYESIDALVEHLRSESWEHTLSGKKP